MAWLVRPLCPGPSGGANPGRVKAGPVLFSQHLVKCDLFQETFGLKLLFCSPLFSSHILTIFVCLFSLFVSLPFKLISYLFIKSG